MEFDYYAFIIGPLLIFLARLCDVSLGTVRIIFVSKGYKTFAACIGFFEVLIWILAISSVMQRLDNWVYYVAYAAGFATGNYVGMLLDEKMAIGYDIIRVITKAEANELVQVLRNEGYGTTVVHAQGRDGDVAVIYIIINRRRVQDVVSIIKQYNPKAFYTVEDIRFVNRDLNTWHTAKHLGKRK